MAEYSIGEFEFISMTPSPPGLALNYNYISYSGHDGHDVWQDAVRGMPFRTVTRQFTNTIQDALQLHDEYETAQREDPGPHDLEFASLLFEWKVLVMRVTKLDCRSVVAVYVDGVRKRGRLTAMWDLLVVDPDLD